MTVNPLMRIAIRLTAASIVVAAFLQLSTGHTGQPDAQPASLPVIEKATAPDNDLHAAGENASAVRSATSGA